MFNLGQIDGHEGGVLELKGGYEKPQSVFKLSVISVDN